MPDDVLNPQQVIANLQRELAARTAERDEALARETAVAEVLQVINATPGELAPVFDAMLEKAIRLSEAAFGVLYILSGELCYGAATRNFPPELEDLVRKPFKPSGDGFVQKALRGEAVEHVTDLDAAGIRVTQDPRVRAYVDLGGARTMLNVALVREGTVLGALSFFRREVRPFTDKQLALLQNFAAQAVIAMENARLITETREALEQQTATAEVLQVINASPGELAPIFDAMLET